MTYKAYRYVFLGAGAAAAIMLVLAVVLFFTLRIPQVIGNLSGRTARKAIENIRLQNERSGDKTYQSSAVNLRRGKITDKISESGRLLSQEGPPSSTGMVTEKISTQQLACQENLEETTVLTDTGETTVLDSSVDETTVLEPARQVGQAFTLEFEITFIHTDEEIA